MTKLNMNVLVIVSNHIRQMACVPFLNRLKDKLIDKTRFRHVNMSLLSAQKDLVINGRRDKGIKKRIRKNTRANHAI